jgi:antitoxin component YwqK of YwqJK toxin-antitoxin module
MRFLLIFLFILNCAIAQVADGKYAFNKFHLVLKPDGMFAFYKADASVLEIVSGNYSNKNDSIILTTREADNETIIFMIFKENDSLVLERIYLQKQFHSEKILLPKNFYLIESYHKNLSTKQKLYWEDYASKKVAIYQFTDDKKPVSINNYKNDLLHGEQVTYFNSYYPTQAIVSSYKQGVKHGVEIFYNPKGQVQKAQKWKNDTLKKEKIFLL